MLEAIWSISSHGKAMAGLHNHMRGARAELVTHPLCQFFVTFFPICCGRNFERLLQVELILNEILSISYHMSFTEFGCYFFSKILKTSFVKNVLIHWKFAW